MKYLTAQELRELERIKQEMLKLRTVRERIKNRGRVRKHRAEKQ